MSSDQGENIVSEDSGLSEQSVPESDSSAPEVESSVETQPTEAETVSPPKKADKKKLWIMIVAIVVAAALITSAVVLVMGDLKVTITQDPEGVIPAGKTVTFSVSAKIWGKSVTDHDDTDVSWSVSPSSLGELDRTAAVEVEFKAADVAGTGSISCEVTYGSKKKTATLDVTVSDPTLDIVVINPPTKYIDIDEEFTFAAAAINSIGESMTGATFEWSVSGMDSADYTLSATSGESVTFSGSVEGIATLSAEATVDSETSTGEATVYVGYDVGRSADYLWYDMFDHPIEEWYDFRAEVGNEEFRLTDEYPYLYIWEGAPPGNVWVYTFMRLNVDGNNITEVNMNENPEFLPFFGDEMVRGGNAEIDWYLNYITHEEGMEKLGSAAMGYFDGWYVALNGTVTLDQQAAMAVLGLTSADFEDFDDWWDDEGSEITNLWEEWMIHEASPDRLDIFWMYEYPLQFVLFEIDAEKVGDEVVLTMDTISWGAEALLTRWLHESFMPTEWYFEDMNFDASISGDWATIDIDTAVQYAVYAYETTLEADPCWDWEALMQDYVLSGVPPVENKSLYDRYWNWDFFGMLEYYNAAPGSDWYDKMMDYDYAPGLWNLSEDETLTLEWPEGEQVFIMHDPGAPANDVLNYSLIQNVSVVMGEMHVSYAEPMPSDAPDFISIDTDARQIVYTGPFDMWEWSTTQTAHKWLADEWDRLGVLPYGMPFVEFRPPIKELDLEIEGMPTEVEMGEVVTFTVKAVNPSTSEVVTDYAGEVTFTSDDGAAVLPADYTFDPGTDEGEVEFTVTFNTVDPVTHDGTFYLTVTDTSDDSVSATASSIHVVESPVIDHFGVEFGGVVYAEEAAGATVTAYNQWDEVFTGYEGTAEFESNDTGAVIVPDSLDFTGLDGVGSVDVTFSSHGDQYLNVSDSVVTEATGSALVAVNPVAVIHHFELSGVNNPAQPNIAETLRVTAIDQYDRDFDRYEETVAFETNRTGEVTLPPATAFTLGEAYIDVPITFTAPGMFMVWANESDDDTITGSLEVWVYSGTLELDHFNVFGITNMWENNYSSVTVEAISTVDTRFGQYDGTVEFFSNPSVGVELPPDYTFVAGIAGDAGIHTFVDAVSFEDPGLYNVSVQEVGDPTKYGYQDEIDIENLYAETLVVTGAPDTLLQNDTFSVTVTVYHQHDLVFDEYDGIVEFDSTDDSGYANLPGDYTFQPFDAGTHDFPDLSLSKLGVQTVTVEDSADSSLTDSVDIEVILPATITYKIYDLFGEDWGDWWTTREDSAWDTDRALTEGAGSMTYLYDAFDDWEHGIIYTPYRWNIEGSLLPNLDVHEPMFMPIEGTPGQSDAEATVEIYAQYLKEPVYAEQWVSYWDDSPDWETAFVATLDPAYDDGWIMGTWINVTMNRAAALEWLGLPTGEADPAGWWDTNRDAYRTAWEDWIIDQGNEVYDIFNGYDYAYQDLYGGPVTKFEVDGDEIILRMGHVTYGYEALLTRWLADSGLSMHQAYFEDIEMTLEYCDDTVNVSMDAVCQWSLKCVKQNATAPELDAPCAWAWFPTHLDYLVSSPSHPVSAYDPYYPLTYHGWNCGDPYYDTATAYEYTPIQFTLPSYGRLIVELPMDDVIGYNAEPVPATAVFNAFRTSGASFETYDNLRYMGEMDLGYCDLSLAGDSVWFAGNKTLIVQGPWEPENPRAEPGLLYNGAPWLEFNVNPSPTAAASSAAQPSWSVPLEEPTPTSGTQVTSSTSAAAELVSLTMVIAAVMILMAALVVGAGRRHDL